MTISKRSFYHGAALAEVTDNRSFSSINRIPSINSYSAYQINHNIGIYIKYTSDSDMFKFSFSSDNKEEIRKMNEIYQKNTYIALVCSEDGICLLNYEMLISCIDLQSDENDWININRPNGCSYRVRGSKGECDRSIPLNAFPNQIFLQA